MRILASGCSFTAGWEEPGANWPSMIGKRNIVKNLAQANAGNRYIAQSVQLELLNHAHEFDIVLVMWSGLQRLDIMINDWVYDALDSHHTCVDGMYCYSHLGDAYSHKHAPSLVRNTAKSIFQITNEEINACNSLLEMINLQNLLEINKIDYRFMSYVNYWNTESKLPNLNFGIYKYPSCQQLAKKINFDKFLFYNDSMDGFYEFAEQNNMIDTSDHFHPSRQAHQEWATFIREKL